MFSKDKITKTCDPYSGYNIHGKAITENVWRIVIFGGHFVAWCWFAEFLAPEVHWRKKD